MANRLLGKSRLRAMVGEQLGLRLGPLAQELRVGPRDPGVQLAAPVPEQGAVGRVLHQCVLERVAPLGWLAALVHQPRGRQPLQPVPQLGLRERGDGR